VDRLLFLGVGTIASAVQRALPAVPAVGTTRSAPDQRFRTITPIPAHDATAISRAAQGAKVVVSFPPDGHVDRAWSTLVSGAASIAYLSSTAVYPATAGIVTEASAVSAGSERASLRLEAERLWRDVGASVVRLPAFYGLSSGLHLSLGRGTFRMPGSGSNIVSRVHEDDAARFVCAALSAAPGSLLLAGDDEPAPVAEVVEFVCARFGLPPPARSEGEQIPLSLRASRSIDNRVTKSRHQIQLAYPSYREGYQAIYLASRAPLHFQQT
jgi:nucleoside-diphosphate-sugar epimerase